MTRISCPRKVMAVLFVLVAICTSPVAAQQAPPDAPWRTLDTEHFRVTFPGHLEALARRAGGQAEWAYARLSEHFVHGPEGPIDIVLTDHTDVSNGYATPFPSNRIVLFARPPVDSFQLGYFDDWQQLLIVHELTHIFHLDRPGRYSVRRLFGRIPFPVFGFPAFTTPRWVIEGIGTWYESALTGNGRVLGTFTDMVLRTAALEGRFESIGQAGGSSPLWPGGNRAYTYGPMFFEYLLRKHGRDRMEAFVEAVENQWIPYRLNAAGRSAFGVSMSHEWAAWADAWLDSVERLDARLAKYGAITVPERLTDGARYADHPKVSPDGSALIYIRSDGRSDTRLVSASPIGGRETTIARTRGRRFTFAPNGDIVVDQLEYSGRYRRFRDLYRVTPDGAVQRLTTAARLSAPSVGPGDGAVAVAEGGGTNGLVRVNINTGAIDTLVHPEDGVYWALPAVSPDGRRIAATRWAGGNHDIVILDERGGLVSQVTRDRALDFAPAWSPDGRWLVWASDRTGILNILAARFDGAKAAAPVMLTNVRTGAAMPSVDPSGKWLYFSGYHVDGWEVERIPFDPVRAPIAPPYIPDSSDTAAGRTAREVAASAGYFTAAGGGQIRAWSPLQTLLPRFWIPIGTYSFSGAGSEATHRTRVLGASVGAFTSGVDLVGRHAYALTARAFLPTGGYAGGRGAGLLTYRYAGLGNPVLGLSVSQSWDEERVRVRKENGDALVDTTFVLERTRYAALSMTMARPRAWSNLSFTLSGGVVREDREALDSALNREELPQFETPSSTLGEVGARFSASTARSHAFQIGNAAGASFSVLARRRIDLDRGSSDDRSLDDATGDVRAYMKLPGGGFAAPVLALRASAGIARGPGSGRGHFSIGGSDRRVFPVRGYEGTPRSSRRAWTASLELRLPASLANRAFPTDLLHFDRAFLTLFADAGNAWGRNASPTARPQSLLAAGGEVVYSVGMLCVPFRFRIGAAYGFTEPKGAVPHVHLGTSF